MMKTINKLTSNIFKADGMAQLITRFSIAVVMWPHGAQLLLGSFGGGGYADTMAYFTQQAGLPWIIGLLVILIQFFGSLLILMGLFTRLTSLAMAIIVIGMIFSGHVEHGFFMNWFGTQSGEGYEFHLLLLGLCLSLFFSKEYKYAMDRGIFYSKKRN